MADPRASVVHENWAHCGPISTADAPTLVEVAQIVCSAHHVFGAFDTTGIISGALYIFDCYFMYTIIPHSLQLALFVARRQPVPGIL